ncbi:MAG: phycobilisome protein [Cyanothece sp. SIO2G6]|nr:phycobilisome protein [Cyanothece sp. SIO2G6]
MSTSSLSDRAKELIAKARIVSFESWNATHPPELVQRFQQADDDQYYLTDDDLVAIETLAPDTTQFLPVVRLLRDRAPDIVDEARSTVLSQFPHILEPGGGLYPPMRADACWRDFWHFLRCITYGIAGQHADYTSPTGLHYMNLLYQELQVPLDAMVVGLEGVKTAALKRLEDSALQVALSPYFDQLIDQLRQFESS